ncbi:MAG: quinol:cytochrome C oxidoreductase [Elusimicrobiota bacterium]
MTAERFWANWLLWFLFLSGTGLGCLFIVALEHLVGARWSVPIRRVCERLSGLLNLAVPLGLIALFSLPVLYPWARPEAAANPLIAGKAAWLNIPFFCARTVVCLALWALCRHIFVGRSLEQDETKDPEITVRLRRAAPAFMFVFALTVTLVSFDWLSSLDPEWYSDIFGVYVFAGFFLAGLAATTLGITYLTKQGRLPGVRFDHIYNLGAFMFAFTVFWSYIGFAQYMLMWYANLPEEVFWYIDRTGGAWGVIALAMAVLHFVIPFFALIPRGAKGDLPHLAKVSIIVLAAHFLDLYWLIFPALGGGPLFSWPELLFAAVFLTAGLLWCRMAMRRGEDMPVGDPFLKEGLEFRL